MITKEDLEDLEDLIENLKLGIQIARRDIAAEQKRWGYTDSPFVMKDTTGRYLLADLYATYANVLVSYHNLKRAFHEQPVDMESWDNKQEEEREAQNHLDATVANAERAIQ